MPSPRDFSSERAISAEKSGRPRPIWIALLPIVALVLWWSRPRALTTTSEREDAERRTCLDNLQRISRAFAQYAQDFDGKYPRGVDAEDRFNPNLWREPRRGAYHAVAQSAPLLPDLLRPYLSDRAVWRCPSDNGFARSNLPIAGSSLTNVFPSAFQRYGLSYSYFTIHGFAEMRAAEVDDPGGRALLFDSHMWHSSGGRPTINVLFGDGHTQNVTPDLFVQLSYG